MAQNCVTTAFIRLVIGMASEKGTRKVFRHIVRLDFSIARHICTCHIHVETPKVQEKSRKVYEKAAIGHLRGLSCGLFRACIRNLSLLLLFICYTFFSVIIWAHKVPRECPRHETDSQHKSLSANQRLVSKLPYCAIITTWPHTCGNVCTFVVCSALLPDERGSTLGSEASPSIGRRSLSRSRIAV